MRGGLESALAKLRHKHEAPWKQGEQNQWQPIDSHVALESSAKFLAVVHGKVLHILGLWKGPKNMVWMRTRRPTQSAWSVCSNKDAVINGEKMITVQCYISDGFQKPKERSQLKSPPASLNFNTWATASKSKTLTDWCNWLRWEVTTCANALGRTEPCERLHTSWLRKN